MPDDNFSPGVSLTMIVKNEQANLAKCLAGVSDLVNEIIVVDTGSSDDTRAIAKRYGARVFEFPWIDDFAAARNQALGQASKRWIFWLDADDRIDAENHTRLKKLFASLPDDHAAYHMACKSIDPSGTTVADHVRLFRNRPDVRWQFRIHEQILPAVTKSGGISRSTDVVILHTGYHDPLLHRRKLERNLKLLELERKEHPNEAAVLYHLGVNYTAVGRPVDAIPVLKEGLRLSRGADPYVRQFHGQLARAHHQLGQKTAALAVCREGTARFPDDAELLFVESTLLTETGDLPGAEKRLLKLIDPASKFVSGDSELTGCKARQNLAMIYRKQNRLGEAERQLRCALAQQPQFALARLALADVCLAQNRPEEVEELLAPLQSDEATAVDVALLRGRAHLARRELAAARSILENAVENNPAQLRLLVLLTQIHLEQGTDHDAAEKSLRAILKIDPNHAAAKRTLETMGLK